MEKIAGVVFVCLAPLCRYLAGVGVGVGSSTKCLSIRQFIHPSIYPPVTANQRNQDVAR